MLNDFQDVRDKGEQRPVLCNGKTVHISMNLYLALLEFRRMKYESPLWSDQICINQQDNLEKIPQLAIMAQLYASASTVIIWLDTLSTVRSLALDFVESLPDNPVRVARTSSEPQMEQSVLGKIKGSVNAAKDISSSIGKNAQWITVSLTFGCAWFDRIWTLQEFMLASRFKIMMGNREVSQSSIVKAATQIFDFYATDSLSVSRGVNNITNGSLGLLTQNRVKIFEQRINFHNGKRYTAAEYLIIARRRDATLKKDLVFAGAGLLEQGAPESVNYFSTTRDVFCAFAIERLWPQTGIDSLSLVGGTTQKVEGLPSWVPDLSTELIPQPLRFCGGQVLSSRTSPQLARTVISAQTLGGKAARWSSVDRVGETLWSWTSWGLYPYNTEEDKRGTTQVSKNKMRTSTTALQEKFGVMLSLLDGMGEAYNPTGERPIDALFHALLGGASCVQGEDAAIWRDRFYNFFALTYLDNRNALEARMNSKAVPKPWKVPLVQDLPQMEQRVSSFLEAHDHALGQEPVKPVSKLISDLTDRLYGGNTATTGRNFGGLRAAFWGDASHEPASIFAAKFTKIYDGRRIFLSANGYLGISSEDVRAGDSIMLVAGADVPYILRPVEGKDATFTLVGEAYVHGLAGHAGINENDLTFNDIQIV